MLTCIFLNKGCNPNSLYLNTVRVELFCRRVVTRLFCCEHGKELILVCSIKARVRKIREYTVYSAGAREYHAQRFVHSIHDPTFGQGVQRKE